MLLFISLFLIDIFFFATIFFLIFFKGKSSKTRPLLNANNLKISLVIAAKNESKNIEKLAKSLVSQKFSHDNFEIILVDDGSDDGTPEAAKNFFGRFKNFRLLPANEKKYAGKKGALQLGVENSLHEFIAITDADCEPASNWLSGLAKKFSEGYDLVFGLAPFFSENNFVDKISRFENLRSSMLSFGLANAGFPYSAAARSFGYKKNSFEKIMGYANTVETLSGDDDLLIREAVKHGLRIGAIFDKDALVYSKSKNNLRDYFNQKARHTSTSNYYLTSRQITLGIWHSINILSLLILPLGSLNPLLLLPGSVKILSDIVSVKFAQKKMNYNFSIPEIVYLQFTYEISLIINYINASLKVIDWKK